MNLPQLTIQGKGEPFFWLHGMLNSVEADSLYSMINLNELSKEVSVIRYNYCDKSAVGNYTWPVLTDELFRVADALNFNRVVLGGMSMGSGTVVHAAVRFPERVKALILVSPPPAWEMREMVKKVYKKIASKTNPNNIPEILKRLILQSEDLPGFFEQNYPGTRQRLLESRLSFDPQYYSQIYLDGAASDFPSREQIAEIDVPTLIVTLPNDENHPLKMAQELIGLIKGSELLVISDYDDYLNLQNKAIDFLNKVSRDNKS
ncbi:MAG TPA: alpha/beta hydrolase [Prolixibacteraceae bacterium]|nr:alpha/beta hydrolase [Prolixibacteraceae bacterium]